MKGNCLLAFSCSLFCYFVMNDMALWIPYSSQHLHDHCMHTGCTLEDIYNDGTQGIMLTPASEGRPAVRIKSLMALEARSRGVDGARVDWRKGVAMRKEVFSRKVILYALIRRMEASAVVESARLQAAIEELTALRAEVATQRATAAASKAAAEGLPAPKVATGKLCTLRQLAEYFQQNEVRPSEYEEKVLLWQPVSAMRRGNPKRPPRGDAFATMQLSHSPV